jgi:hypothetical protein
LQNSDSFFLAREFINYLDYTKKDLCLEIIEETKHIHRLNYVSDCFTISIPMPKTNFENFDFEQDKTQNSLVNAAMFFNFGLSAAIHEYVHYICGKQFQF